MNTPIDLTLPPCPRCGEVKWRIVNDEQRTYTVNQEGVLTQDNIEMLEEHIECHACGLDPLTDASMEDDDTVEVFEDTWYDNYIDTFRDAYDAADKAEMKPPPEPYVDKQEFECDWCPRPVPQDMGNYVGYDSSGKTDPDRVCTPCFNAHNERQGK